MRVLDSIASPRDLRPLNDEQLTALAAEIRDLLVSSCARVGGHLGPNLGVVELTIAVHRVFESPRDRVVFDTGHQAYVHKMLTGRADAFSTLRQEGGLSGYPSQAESEHDIVENSHASTALSYADGLAKAFAIRGEDRHVVAVIGDGALTGGMAWEALNNIAIAADSKLVIVVNDNGRSYTPTIGGLANALTSLRTSPRYEKVLELVKRRLNAVPGVGHATYDVLHAMKKGLKDALAPQGLFEDLGLKYVGPVDGHDRAAMEQALAQAKRFGGPVIVHAITRKGFGYDAAERHEADQFHSPGPFDMHTGDEHPKARIWTDVFADEIVHIGHRRQDVVAITAAMMHMVGLHHFQAHFPERTFDVGIAEQHAATSAAGLAMGGLHPVVAVYATFLNRAFDQVLMDCALHRCGVTFVLDRAGVTGDDGAPITACGTCRCCRSSPACVSRPPATPPGSASYSTRPSRSRTRRPSSGSPRVRRRRTSRRWARAAVPTYSSEMAPRTFSSSRSVRWPAWVSRWATGSTLRGSASPSSTRVGSSRSTLPWSSWPASTGWSRPSRTTASSAASAPCSCRRSPLRASTPRCASTASRSSSCTTPTGHGSWSRSTLLRVRSHCTSSLICLTQKPCP